MSSTKALSGRGLFGTEHMLKWGENDPQDIPHEVGHMLGNKDEYGTVDGHDFEKDHKVSDPDTHSVMYKGNEPVRERHFSLIFDKIRRSGILGEDIRLVKNVQSSKIIKTPTSDSSSRVSATDSIHIGDSPRITPPESRIIATQELNQMLHARRVKQITEFLMDEEKLPHLSEQQETYLSSHDWNSNPDYSAAAKHLLGI